jgi:hypothetical protein
LATLTVPEPEFDELKLYNSQHSYFDFNVDENGVWVIYGLRRYNTTVVVKFDPATLAIEYAWNVTLDHQKVGDMFIVCGVLYAVDSLTDGETKIRFGLDLYYHQQLSEVDLTFSNPFRLNTMVGYNPRTKVCRYKLLSPSVLIPRSRKIVEHWGLHREEGRPNS